jgi:beta-glucosidase
VAITIDPAASNHPLSVWSTGEGKWITPSGEYVVWLGRSSSPADLVEAGRIRIP